MATELKKTITSGDIVDCLKRKYTGPSWKADEWVYVQELRAGAGYDRDANRYIDFWALHAYGGHTRISYEIKVSRGDFLRELKDPKKRRMALFLSNEFYFIAPAGMIKPEELPPETGLVEVTWTDNQKEIDEIKQRNEERTKRYPDCILQSVPEYEEFLKSRIIVKAPWRDSLPPTWNFVASIMRRREKDEKQAG